MPVGIVTLILTKDCLGLLLMDLSLTNPCAENMGAFHRKSGVFVQKICRGKIKKGVLKDPFCIKRM
jgi:hypothetical protein